MLTDQGLIVFQLLFLSFKLSCLATGFIVSLKRLFETILAIFASFYDGIRDRLRVRFGMGVGFRSWSRFDNWSRVSSRAVTSTARRTR